jgi:predicted oxidoreductase
MTAALVGAIEGLRVLLIEKSGQVGGTSARSSGSVWIPDNPEMRRRGIAGDAGLALRYLDALVGDRAERVLRQAFLAAGPEMLAFLERHTDLRF